MGTLENPTKKKAAKKVKAGTSKVSADTRRTAFVEAFIANGQNGTEAAIAAGFSPKTAGAQASRLLKDVKTQQLLADRRKVLAEKFELRTEDVLRELARIVYADPRKAFDANGNLLPVSEWPDEVAAMIASIEVDEMKVDGAVVGLTKKVKLWDKNSAIDKAMKHLGQYEKDNAQKHPLQEMNDAALDKFIERKLQESGKTLH